LHKVLYGITVKLDQAHKVRNSGVEFNEERVFGGGDSSRWRPIRRPKTKPQPPEFGSLEEKQSSKGDGDFST